jgi:methylglyoxal synthase
LTRRRGANDEAGNPIGSSVVATSAQDVGRRIVHLLFARSKRPPHIVDRMDIDGRRRVRPAMGSRKRIVMIAHDNRKHDLVDWASYNAATLARHDLAATGTTGKLLADTLGLPIERYLSGPLGGDQQIGAAIAEGRVDLVVFFWDPLEPQPHDVDVKALLRIAVVYNTPIACNRSSADFLLSSPLMDEDYAPFANSA